jgi:CheY-like chemotaxis protein
LSVSKKILVVEDGHEYTEAFRRLAGLGPGLELLRAADAEEARRLLASGRVDALFLDVVFDRTPPERLCGDLAPLLARYGGDRHRAERHLAEDQGFYLLTEIAPLLPPETPVLLAYDFSGEPGRLAALRERVPSLRDLPDGTPISRALEMLTGREA